MGFNNKDKRVQERSLCLILGTRDILLFSKDVESLSGSSGLAYNQPTNHQKKENEAVWHLLLSPPFFLLLLLFLSLSFSVLCVCVSTIGYLDLRASRAERGQEKERETSRRGKMEYGPCCKVLGAQVGVHSSGLKLRLGICPTVECSLSLQSTTVQLYMISLVSIFLPLNVGHILFLPFDSLALH